MFVFRIFLVNNRKARDVKVSEVEFNQEFIARLIPKVDWECLCRAAEQLGHLDDLPKSMPENYENDLEFLKKAHHALLEVCIVELLLKTRILLIVCFQADLSMETNQKSVTGAIQVLSSRLSLLNPSHLDHVEGRLAALLQKMNTLAERKSVIEDSEKQSKISELYDLCIKTEANAVVLPEIVDRLDSLQTLHEQGIEE